MGDCSAREEVEEIIQASPKVYFWSDYNSVQWMRKQPDPRGKISIWILELEAINYVVIFRKGSKIRRQISLVGQKAIQNMRLMKKKSF